MNRITSTITEGNNAPVDQDPWKKRATAWTVTLHYQGRQYTFPFWTGTGFTSKPNTFDAAHCVLSDASGFENSQGFEDWASDYGYDTDSRSAEDIYRATERVHRNIMRLLGDDYTTLVYMDEETLQERTR